MIHIQNARPTPAQQYDSLILDITPPSDSLLSVVHVLGLDVGLGVVLAHLALCGVGKGEGEKGIAYRGIT